MGTARIIATVAVLLHMATVCAQTPYPELTIQDVSWMEGTHHYAVTNSILSPATPERPTEVGASADVEFVSATEVRLLPGFHAGGFNSQGQFHARIDQGLGQPADLVIVSPAPDGSSPYGSIEDNVVHVHKWEKVEVGLRLPQEYQEAIDRFFAHYYPYSNDPYASAPSNTNAAHDLNPYADDSLQVVLTLTRPDGSQAIKWGFFMRESTWGPGGASAKLEEDPTNELYPYNIRIRFSPDLEGAWDLHVSIKAPYTTTPSGTSLPELSHTGYTLLCEPSLPDNNGYLEVNGSNQRTLRFAGGPEQGDETPFFGLGVNLGDKASSGLYYLQSDFDRTSSAMVDLSANGGNFVRMFLMGTAFSPEVVNRGVYDRYHALHCYMQEPPIGNNPPHLGNGQNNCWAFDRLLEHARNNDIYFQLCIDPFPPVIFIESTVWETNAYVKPFLDPHRDPGTGTYDMKRFFYSTAGNLDPDLPQAVRLMDEGVFYYWKRKYKYIMSRWGYSVNIPIIEPFNEIDQMLTYNYADLRPVTGGTTEQQHYDICPLNKRVWNQDPLLPTTISDWLTDLFDYVRGPVDLDNLETSPLGESNKLVLMSYAGGGPTNTSYHLPFTNEHVDLIDAHRAPDNPLDLQVYIAQGEEFRTNFTSNGIKKPFHHGEFTTYGNYHTPDQQPYTFEYGSTLKLFDNYDVSFHNELWASTFGGSFAAGTTWSWDRVFWWPEGLPVPPADSDNPFPRSNTKGATNHLRLYDSIGQPFYVPVINSTLHHHFKPLRDFLNSPNVEALGLYMGDFTPHIVEANGIECFYLINAEQDVAVGWIHNANAYWRKAVYITSQYQHYLECEGPTAQSVDIDGFLEGTELYISYFPTRIGMSELPNDAEDEADTDGRITLNMAPANLNGIFPQSGQHVSHLDTLHADYAFVVAPWQVKSLNYSVAYETSAPKTTWDFQLYPNPAHSDFFLRFHDDELKSVSIIDLAGRTLRVWNNIADRLKYFSTDGLVSGAYYIRVSNGANIAIKKLIVN